MIGDLLDFIAEHAGVIGLLFFFIFFLLMLVFLFLSGDKKDWKKYSEIPLEDHPDDDERK